MTDELECKDEFSDVSFDVDCDDPYFWYVNGADCEPFNLNRAPGAVSFGKPPFHRMSLCRGFATTLRRHSVMVCRVYWKQLAWDGYRGFRLGVKFPLRVRIALSFILGSDVTRCRDIDIYHYFADVFGFVECEYLPPGRPAFAEDLKSLTESLGLRDELVCAGAVVQMIRLDYEF